MTSEAKFVLLGVLVAFVSVGAAQKTSEEIARPKVPGVIDVPREEFRHYRTMRIVDDPGTGTKWVIERDLRHPSGPGKMVVVSGEGFSGAPRGEHQENQNSQILPVPIIHSGDFVLVIEKGNVLDASFEGVAVSSARSGESVSVRLKIGGHTLEGVAIEPGKVRLLPWTIGAYR